MDGFNDDIDKGDHKDETVFNDATMITVKEIQKMDTLAELQMFKSPIITPRIRDSCFSCCCYVTKKSKANTLSNV